MGNWSRIIVCFSGLDALVSADNAPEEQRRVDDVVAALVRADPKLRHRHTVYSCSLPGGPCEVTVIFDAKNWDPNTTGTTLRAMDWSDGHEVQIFEKDEDSDQYRFLAMGNYWSCGCDGEPWVLDGIACPYCGYDPDGE